MTADCQKHDINRLIREIDGLSTRAKEVKSRLKTCSIDEIDEVMLIKIGCALIYLSEALAHFEALLNLNEQKNKKQLSRQCHFMPKTPKELASQNGTRLDQLRRICCIGMQIDLTHLLYVAVKLQLN